MHARLLKPAEVAERLGVSRSWLYEAARTGRIPSVRLGDDDGPLRFIETDIDEWLERGRAAWLPAAVTLRIDPRTEG
jgi:excisionase family DNA binding protein